MQLVGRQSTGRGPSSRHSSELRGPYSHCHHAIVRHRTSLHATLLFARRAPRRPDFTGKHRRNENSPTYRAKTMHLIGHVRSRLPDMCRDLACPWPSAVLPPARLTSAPLSLDFELGLPWDVIKSAVQCSIALARMCAEGFVPAEHSVRLGVRCSQLEMIRHSLLCSFAGISAIFSAALSLNVAKRKGQVVG